MVIFFLYALATPYFLFYYTESVYQGFANILNPEDIHTDIRYRQKISDQLVGLIELIIIDHFVESFYIYLNLINSFYLLISRVFSILTNINMMLFQNIICSFCK